MKRILLLSLCLVQGTLVAQKSNEGWTSLFNGKDLTGWKPLNGHAKFEAVEGMIQGTTVAGEPNSFLATENSYGDFVLELDFKMEGTNSGVQVRSESKPDYQNGRVHGYQADFDPTARAWTGGLYEEGRRGWLYPLDYNPGAKSLLKLTDWNTCRIECIGNSIKTWINGQPVASIIDNVTPTGFIALQVHSVSNAEVGRRTWWRNIKIKTKSLKATPSSIFTADLVQADKMKSQQKGFWLEENPESRKINLLHEGKLITSYCYYDSVFKPVLHPILGLEGSMFTREFPLVMKPGERADHPHQIGWFFTHESVNGLDFWNSSTAIQPKDRIRYGKIAHTRYLYGQGWTNDAYLTTQAQWRAPDKSTLLEEMTRFHFTKEGKDLIIDRTTDLRAVIDQVTFKDAKDALVGLRVARALELPSKWEDAFVLADGTVSKTKMANNDGATGQFLNSEGITGEAIWGKRAKWICLYGEINGRKVSLAFIDNKNNLTYPTYWHARGYGLLSANPLGTSIFTEGKESLNFALKKDEVLKLSYRLVLREGSWMKAEEINRWADSFNP